MQVHKAFSPTLSAAYLRQGYEEWIMSNSPPESIPCGCSPIFHGDSLYILNWNGKLARLSFMDAGLGMHGDILSYDQSFGLITDYNRGFLVSCGGNRYSVIVGLLGKYINVYKLEQGSSEWIEVKDIANFSFFISQTSSFAVPVTEVARQNTINFPLFDENEYVYYKLDEGVFKVHHGGQSKVDIYQRKDLFNGTWLQPKAVKAYRYNQ